MRVDGEAAIVDYLVAVRESGFDPKALFFQFRHTEFFLENSGAWLAIAAMRASYRSTIAFRRRVDPERLHDYEGQYTYRLGFPSTYTVESGHLIDEFKGEKIEVFPMGKYKFFEREDLGWVTFVRDPQGRVTGYVYHYADGQTAVGERIKS